MSCNVVVVLGTFMYYFTYQGWEAEALQIEVFETLRQQIRNLIKFVMWYKKQVVLKR